MRIPFFTTLFLVSMLHAFSQTCTPNDTISTPGIYPRYLDTATVGEPYEHVLQILAVKDTTVEFGGNTISATVDSIVINDIQGLPASFSYSCYPLNCVYTHDSVGCAKLSGQPSAAEAGEHLLSIIITSYARWNSIKLPVTDTIKAFTLVVEDSATASISAYSGQKTRTHFDPANSYQLKVFSQSPVYQAHILDQLGRELRTYTLAAQKQFVLDIGGLSSGMYFLYLETEQGLQIVKWRRWE